MLNWFKRLLGLPESEDKPFPEKEKLDIPVVKRRHKSSRNTPITTIGSRDKTDNDDTMLNLMAAAIIADELSHTGNSDFDITVERISTPSFEGDGGSSGGGGSEGSWDSGSSSDSSSSYDSGSSSSDSGSDSGSSSDSSGF